MYGTSVALMKLHLAVFANVWVQADLRTATQLSHDHTKPRIGRPSFGIEFNHPRWIVDNIVFDVLCVQLSFGFS